MSLENIMDQEVKTLSGGELQRVAIVLALGESLRTDIGCGRCWSGANAAADRYAIVGVKFKAGLIDIRRQTQCVCLPP
jgi:hypothetical protein